MRSLLYTINVTLDGCVDHTAATADRELHEHAAATLAGADALIFGRITYEMMRSAWRRPAETGERPEWAEEWTMPFAQTIHRARKYVVSDSLAAVDWNAELIRGHNLETVIRRLKNERGKRLYVGGVTLPTSLAKLGLIDEYEFIVHPTVAGRGPRLLDGLSAPLDLKLIRRSEFRSGAVVLRYELRR